MMKTPGKIGIKMGFRSVLDTALGHSYTNVDETGEGMMHGKGNDDDGEWHQGRCRRVAGRSRCPVGAL